MSDTKQSYQPRVNGDSIRALESAMGYQFKEKRLIDHALTHSSAKTNTYPSNERLEFFGDAVLGMVITEMIFHRFPEFPEGELTRLKSSLVSREMLAQKAEELLLERYALLGKGVGKRDDLPKSILANLFEAVVCAVYLDGSYRDAKAFILRIFDSDVDVLVGRHVTRNYKSALQQLVQARLGVTPSYLVLQEDGPDHDKRFEVAAMINDREYGVGIGNSKKEAEQTAARIALQELLGSLDLGEDSMLLELDDEDDVGFKTGIWERIEEGDETVDLDLDPIGDDDFDDDSKDFEL
ncbi:MAG: ribonuclease III [Planctomycetes bacterium]|nr:ribonuclease III [Planctomycetota bacterium]